MIKIKYIIYKFLIHFIGDNMRNFFYIIVLGFFICTFFVIEYKQDRTSEETIDVEKRAVFFSYLDFNYYIRNKSEEESKKNIRKILDDMEKNNFNMLILHVRSFSDAIYDSKIFPTSDSVKVNGAKPSYDVLKYFIDYAKEKNIEVHAWINPYRISQSEDINTLPKDSPAYNMDSNDVKVIKGKGIYYNPSSKRVEDLIIDGIEEILNNYEVDGIHFDDYFYPSNDIDDEDYQNYSDNGGMLSKAEYRYHVILSLLKNTYSKIKSINKSIEFGISPEGNIENDYNKHFLDVKTILSKDGYIDYIMPQIYFGFNNQYRPFIKTLNEWNSMIKNKNIRLIPALALYKSGTYDKYAGYGAEEWLENDDIISRQIEESRKLDNYSGFSIFRYQYLFDANKQNNNLKNEITNLVNLINDSK